MQTRAPEALAWPVDAAFAYQPAGRLVPASATDPLDVWRHLSSAISRDPLDLEAHVRRVFLARQTPLTGFVFTALVDLFLALGPRGASLRHSVLQWAEDAISADEAEYLLQSLESGLIRGTPLPLGTHALLDPALMGSPDMVAHQRQAVRQLSTAEQAAALLDEGDLAGARQLLEESLLQHPDDEAATRELLGIYRHSRDDEARRAMGERLKARHGRAFDAWA